MTNILHTETSSQWPNFAIDKFPILKHCIINRLVSFGGFERRSDCQPYLTMSCIYLDRKASSHRSHGLGLDRRWEWRYWGWSRLRKEGRSNTTMLSGINQVRIKVSEQLDKIPNANLAGNEKAWNVQHGGRCSDARESCKVAGSWGTSLQLILAVMKHYCQFLRGKKRSKRGREA